MSSRKEFVSLAKQEDAKETAIPALRDQHYSYQFVETGLHRDCIHDLLGVDQKYEWETAGVD